MNEVQKREVKIYADFYAESLICAEFTLRNARCAISGFAARFCQSIFQPTMVTFQRQAVLYLSFQHQLHVFQEFIIVNCSSAVDL